jgi:hypothetical protein
LAVERRQVERNQIVKDGRLFAVIFFAQPAIMKFGQYTSQHQQVTLWPAMSLREGVAAISAYLERGD